VARSLFVSCALVALLWLPRADASAGTAAAMGSVRNGVPTVSLRAGGAVLRALLDTGGYDFVDPAAAARLGLRSAPVRLRSVARRIVTLDSGDALLVARPDAFASTFLGVPDATVSLAFLRHRVVTVDYARGTVANGSGAGRAVVVPLLLRSGPPPAARLPGQVLAALEVRAGSERTLWLLDTGAEARFTGDGEVSQVSALDVRVAERWHREHPEWPYRRDAAVYAGDDGPVRVDALRVPVRVGSLPVRDVWCVVRHEARAFDYLGKAFGRTVSGDAGASVFGLRAVTFDVGRARLEVR
jgi:hypothetical protein